MGRLVTDDRKATLVTTKERRRAFQNLNEDGLQQQDATLGATPVSPQQGSQAQQNWTVEDWKSVGWSHKSRFQPCQSAGRGENLM